MLIDAMIHTVVQSLIHGRQAVAGREARGGEVGAHALAVVVVERRGRVPHEVKLDVSGVHVAPRRRDGKDPALLSQTLLPLAVLFDAQQDVGTLHAFALALGAIRPRRIFASPLRYAGLLIRTRGGRR